MFFLTRAFVFFGTFLTLVIETPAIPTGARLTKQMESAEVNGGKDAMGSKIFTHEALEDMAAKPEGSGLTLMEFHERAGRVMGVDPKHMDRFLEAPTNPKFKQGSSAHVALILMFSDHAPSVFKWLINTPGYWEGKSRTSRSIQRSLEMGTIKQGYQVDKGVQVLEELIEKINKDPEKTLVGYFLNKVDETVFPAEEQTEFLCWKTAQIWRSRYKDTEKLDILDLLDEYMGWARKHSRLEDTVYVKEWVNGNGDPKKNETIMRLVEGLKRPSETADAKHNEPWWHWRSIVHQMANLWKKWMKRSSTKKSEEKLD
ncbi:hypothetical protein MJO28_014107 [Puccinia striiformis f. sp. tritici]|uniref:Uncharacterized protein n=1 Tax=Puccinia striiformis f. sp. tritici TaxID=168172 RepID=A0ACC0DWU5_9BASI|nr:hypothetical protein MJO28_014107 [Puccinia striiformis f. sp. tritici]